MNRVQTRPIFSAAILILSAVWIIATRENPDRVDPESLAAPQRGFMAPDFTLLSATEEPVTLSALQGQPVLVNLWASWCGPCRAEMPAMQRVYDLYREAGFVVLAVNATNQDSLEAANRFVAEHGLEFPILFDVDGSVSARYRLQALPSSFFIGRDGRIQEVIIGGPMAEALLRTRVEALLRPAR